MKIALVNPRQSDSVVPPLGLLYNAACLLREGFEVYVIDPFFDNRAYLNRLKEIKPDLIGFGILTSSYAAAREQIKIISGAMPKTLLCAGGVHVTSMPEEALENLGLDFVILGEGELTITEVAKRIKHKESLEGVKGVYYKDSSGRIYKNSAREFITDLDKIPYPAWELLPMEKYLIPPGYIRSYYSKRTIVLFATRGCPFGCIYCSSNITFGRKIRFPSTAYTIEGLKQLIKDYQIDSFYFFDDTLTFNKKWVMDFCELKLRNGIKLKWGCQSRVDTISEDIIKMMSESGCVQIDFGVESGSQRVLDTIKKGNTVEQTENAFALCRKYKIRPYASIMIGNPGEQEEDVLLTAKLLKRIKPVYTSVCYTQPMPGSALYDLASSNKWFVDNKSYNSSDWDFRKTIEPLMTINMTKKKQKELRAMLQNQTFMSNYAFFLCLKTIPFIFGLAATLLMKPSIFSRSFRKMIASRKVDDFIDELLFEHRKRIMNKRVRYDYEL